MIVRCYFFSKLLVVLLPIMPFANFCHGKSFTNLRLFFFLIKSYERSEDSYTGLADFFFRKNLKMLRMHSGFYALFEFN